MASSLRFLVPACAVSLLLGVHVASAQLSSDERLCSDQVNKAARNVENQSQKANRGCVKHGSGDISMCVATESEKAAEKRAALVMLYGAGGLCETPPAFGVNSDPDVIADAVENGAGKLIKDIFGDPPNGVPADDKCSDKMAQRTGKMFDTIFKNFRKCAKHLPSIAAVADLEGCVATALGDTANRQAQLDGDVAAECSVIPPPGTEDGRCHTETTAGAFSACLGERVNCQACTALNAIIGGQADCDTLDDGVFNASCLSSQTCTLGAGSKLSLYASGLTQVLAPTGAIDVSCGAPGPNGTAPCVCNLRSFGPINVNGLYWACLSPAAMSCPAVQRDCDGGSSLNLNIAGRRNLASCSSNSNCASQCATLCGGASNVLEAACEGFCSEGAQMACTTDVQCGMAAQGACNGPAGAPLGHVCDCSCLSTVASPAARAGAISCQLALNVTIEALPGDGMPCDGGTPGDGDVLITMGDMCAPMTTEFASGQITNANNSGSPLPSSPFNKSGAPLACSAFDAGALTGLRFASTEVFFGLPNGDLFAGIEAVCQ